MAQILDIRGNIRALLDVLIDWLSCVSDPVSFSDRTLDLTNDRAKIEAVANIWSATIVLTLVVDIPIDRYVGIPWTDVGYYLSCALVNILDVLAVGTAVAIGLRLYKIAIPRVDAIVAYLSATAIVPPVAGALLFLYKLQMFIALKAERAAHHGFLTAWLNTMSQLENSRSASIGGILAYVSSVLVYVFIAIFAKILLKRYAVPRDRLYRATTFSIGVIALPLVLIVSGFSFFVWYAWIG